MEPELFEMLRCPETHQRLLPVTKKWVARLNARIHAGELRTQAGDTVVDLIDDGLVTEDDRFLYPIRGGLADMFVADRILLSVPSADQA